MIRRRPSKPFSIPSWVVGRDFPDPNTRPPGTVPSGPARSTDSIPNPPTPTPPLYPDEGRAADPQQSAAPPAPIPAAEAPPQQPPTPKPRKTRPSAKSNLEPPTSNLQNSESSPQPQASSIQNNFHTGKCSICNHPDRAEIETAFLNWEPAFQLVADFKLPARSTIYRHAKAADLLNQRRKNLLAALDQIVEQAGRVPPTASGVLRAIELSCRLSSGNIAPLKRYEVTHKYIHEPNPGSAPRGGGSSDPSGARPNSESNLQPLTSNLQQQSGHQNIVAEPNSLIPKEGHHKQSGHIGGT